MALFAKIDASGKITKFPVSEEELRGFFPNSSLPAVIVNPPSGFVFVEPTQPPAYDFKTRKLLESTAAKVSGKYVQVWATEALSSDEVMAIAKASRSKLVDEIKVTVAQSGNTYDGDERSQERMARAIVALNDGEKQMWVLANNVPTLVTKEELREALRLAGTAMTQVWATPYQ